MFVVKLEVASLPRGGCYIQTLLFFPLPPSSFFFSPSHTPVMVLVCWINTPTWV